MYALTGMKSGMGRTTGPVSSGMNSPLSLWTLVYLHRIQQFLLFSSFRTVVPLTTSVVAKADLSDLLLVAIKLDYPRKTHLFFLIYTKMEGFVVGEYRPLVHRLYDLVNVIELPFVKEGGQKAVNRIVGSK